MTFPRQSARGCEGNQSSDTAEKGQPDPLTLLVPEVFLIDLLGHRLNYNESVRRKHVACHLIFQVWEIDLETFDFICNK